MAYLHEKDLIPTRNVMIRMGILIKLDEAIHGGTELELERNRTRL
jgi:hypothetical protein